MALFGVPEVAEDDAERAVRTGLDLQAEFLEIHSHIADRNGVDLGLRVGINTGEVVIADDDNDVVGDALNTAARLEAGTDGLSRDQLIRMIQNLKSEPGDEVRLLVSEIHAASDLGLVMSEDFVTLDAEGWDVSRGGVSMIVFGDGVMVGAERWDDTDLAAALARFDEVHAEAGLPPSDRFSDPAKALEAGAVEPPLT